MRGDIDRPHFRTRGTEQLEHPDGLVAFLPDPELDMSGMNHRSPEPGLLRSDPAGLVRGKPQTVEVDRQSRKLLSRQRRKEASGQYRGAVEDEFR